LLQKLVAAMTGRWSGKNTMKDLGDSGSVRRLNWIARAIGAKTYLEVGVLNGKTFRGVRVKTRHAVDPNFRFDTRELADRNTCFIR